MAKYYEDIHGDHMLVSDEPDDAVEIEGYDFNKGVDWSKLIDSFASTGFQASLLCKAVDIIKRMRKEKCKIYLGYTSNMVSSGLRDIFRFLAEHKLVDVIVTTAGGVEEDIIKCLKPFILGSFEDDGNELYKKGLNRAGNILIPNSRYCMFEDWLMPVLKKMMDEQKKGRKMTPSDFVSFLGKEINNERSIYYWAQKNQIPVYCPCLMDGSIGDMIYFFKKNNPDFALDETTDITRLNDFTINAEKTGVVILGAGVVKHYIMNSNLMRRGCDYAVYINNAQEFDGSDSGARPDEAVSWGKIMSDADSVKVFGDATILFPLVVAKAFID
jgi:deoxyhypusine synthase